MSSTPKEYSLPELETFWHQCLLVVILVIAACARFYSLDQNSLSANELSNLASCDIQGWFAMITDYRYHTASSPPLFPTLLCETIDLTSRAEFFIRLLSALAGLAAIYVLYITGRDFISPTAGLLAAAALAPNFHQAIVFSREATPFSLQLLVCLIHNYYFCHLFFFSDGSKRSVHKPRSCTVHFTGKHSSFQWIWHPSFPCDGRFLISFWISGAAVLYTSNSTLILIGAELMASIVLLTQYTTPDFTRRHLLQRLWLPLLAVGVPRLFNLYEIKSWVLAGNVFVLPNITSVWQKLQPLFRTPFMQNSLIVLSSIFILFLTATALLKKNHWLPKRYFAYIAYQLFIALLSLYFVLANDHASHLYFWWLLVLLLMTPLATAITLIPHNHRKTLALNTALLILIIAQVHANEQYKLYKRGGNIDFRLVANIIHEDKNFMNSSKTIYMSSHLFDHYLDSYGITTHHFATIDSTTTVENINPAFNNAEFYYLEHMPYDRALQNESVAFQSLTAQYKTVCQTKMPWLRVVKFSRDPSTMANQTLDCRSYLTETVSLK